MNRRLILHCQWRCLGIDHTWTFDLLHLYRPKRSFGQGNIFTPVCHSVHRGGVCSGGCLLQIFGGVSAPNFSGGLLQIFGGRGESAPNFQGGCLLQIFRGVFLQFSEYGQRSAGTHPTGMHSCLFSIYTGVKISPASIRQDLSIYTLTVPAFPDWQNSPTFPVFLSFF